eukprot:CAMPEP_0115235980 /NCGR_PEP_ID=MMETSP0270-20121206/35604_1 /TAXON_ID=71861 /ORGANISM="Scrippsiella trochoidea, Strain CCMP3099" /LENGTH=187 /DNA_ID=CAMNT_0002650807 /DNA_START=168 /DNA_END=728 /DNA_ORIENTATION=-
MAGHRAEAAAGLVVLEVCATAGLRGEASAFLFFIFFGATTSQSSSGSSALPSSAGTSVDSHASEPALSLCEELASSSTSSSSPSGSVRGGLPRVLMRFSSAGAVAESVEGGERATSASLVPDEAPLAPPALPHRHQNQTILAVAWWHLQAPSAAATKTSESLIVGAAKDLTKSSSSSSISAQRTVFS